MPTSASAVYLDSSALVKLIMSERESEDLERFLQERSTWISCAMARVEVIRAVLIRQPGALPLAEQLLARLHLISLDDELLNDAAQLGPPVLRSLDAIHLAAARTVRPLLSELVAYDLRLASAAQALGFTVVAPGSA